MTPLASISSSLFPLVRLPDLVTGLIGGVLLALLGAATSYLTRWMIRRNTRPDKRLGYCVLSDAPINIGGRLSQGEWKISYRGHDVLKGSIATVELQNTGARALRENDFGRDITLTFPGRHVVDYKVRENADFRDRVQATSPRISGAEDHFALPRSIFEPFNRGEMVQLWVLLEEAAQGPGTTQVVGTAPPKLEVHVDTKIADGDLKEYSQTVLGLTRRLIYTVMALVLGLGLAAGGAAGAVAFSAGPPPGPTCAPAGSKLTLQGSTAFAPIATLLAANFMQSCPNDTVMVLATGSGYALTAFMSANTIGMSDGPWQASYPEGDAGVQRQPVGDLAFAIVANEGPHSDWTQNPANGLSDPQVVTTFVDRGKNLAPDGETVIRNDHSGTWQTFVDKFGIGNPGSTITDLPQESSTMALLNYINENKDTIGFAEADALPFFPEVQEVPLNGYLPTAQNVMNGSYTFYAVENLYTQGPPAGLTADFLNYLNSTAAQSILQGTSFITCGQLPASLQHKDCK
jgi:ABC-type phosphate transport system substrate-binding protein